MVFELKIMWRPKKKALTQNWNGFCFRKGHLALYSAKMYLCNNMSVRTKLMRERSLWNLCARAQLKGNTADRPFWRSFVSNHPEATVNEACELLVVL